MDYGLCLPNFRDGASRLAERFARDVVPLV